MLPNARHERLPDIQQRGIQGCAMAADSSGILQLPPGVIAEIVSLLPLQTTAALQCCKDLLEQTEVRIDVGQCGTFRARTRFDGL